MYRLCGRRAGCVTCLMRTADNESLLRERPELIDVTVDNLLQIRAFLSSQ